MKCQLLLFFICIGLIFSLNSAMFLPQEINKMSSNIDEYQNILKMYNLVQQMNTLNNLNQINNPISNLNINAPLVNFVITQLLHLLGGLNSNSYSDNQLTKPKINQNETKLVKENPQVIFIQYKNVSSPNEEVEKIKGETIVKEELRKNLKKENKEEDKISQILKDELDQLKNLTKEANTLIKKDSNVKQLPPSNNKSKDINLNQEKKIESSTIKNIDKGIDDKYLQQEKVDNSLIMSSSSNDTSIKNIENSVLSKLDVIPNFRFTSKKESEEEMKEEFEEKFNYLINKLDVIYQVNNK